MSKSIVCPPKNSPQWKTMVKHLGEDEAYKWFIAYDYQIPPNSAIDPEFKNIITSEEQLDKILRNSGAFAKRRVKNQYLAKAQKVANDINKDNPGLVKVVASKRRKGAAGQSIYFLELDKSVLKDNQEGQTRMFQFTPVGEKTNPDEELNSKLKNFLQSYGISVRAYNTLKTRTGKDALGIADITNKIISVSKNEQDISTLPEETAHFAVELLGEDHKYVQRMLDLIEETDVFKDVVEEYSEAYEGDILKLKKEAIGKLLATHIIKKHQETAPSNTILRVLKSIWGAVKRVFSIIPKSGIQKEIDNTFGIVAEDILNNSGVEFREENLNKSKGIFYQLKDLIIFDKESKEAVRILEDRIKALKRRGKGQEKNVAKMEKSLISLQKKLDKNKADLVVIEYLKSLAGDLDRINEKATEEKLSQDRTNDLGNFIEMHDEFFDTIYLEYLNNPEAITKHEKILGDFETLKKEFDKAKILYKNARAQRAYESVRDLYQGEGKAEEVLNKDAKDLNFLETFFASAKDVKNEVIRIVHKALLDLKFNAERHSLETGKDLMAAQLDLEKEGLSTDIVHEVDESGKRTGYLVSKYNRGVYYAAKDAVIKRILNRVGVASYNEIDKKSLSKEDLAYYKSQWKAFFEEYHDKDDKGNTIFSSRLLNPQFEQMQDSKAALKYYSTVLKIHEQEKSKLPDQYNNDRNYFLLPQVRGTFYDRMFENKEQSTFDKVKTLTNEYFSIVEDDIEFGEEGAEIKIGNKFKKFVPIHFSSKMENISNLSTDTTAMYTTYSNMAELYKQRAINSAKIELLVSEYQNRDTIGKNGKTIKIAETNISKKLEDLLDAYLYGATKSKQEFTFLGKTFKAGKLLDGMNNFVKLNNLSGNIPTTVAGYAKGSIDSKVEDLVGLYTNNKSKLWADITLTKNMPNMFSEIVRGERLKKNKISLMFEYNNVFKDSNEIFRNVKSKNAVPRVINKDFPYLTYMAADFRVKGKVALAIYDNYRLEGNKFITKNDFIKLNEDKSTKEIDELWEEKTTLWDAYDVVDHKFTIKEEYKDILNDKFINIVRGRINALTHKIDGTITEFDKSIIFRNGFGRLMMTHRGWMVSGVASRFKKKGVDYTIGHEEEGFYMTVGRLINDIWKTDGNKAEAAYANWDKLSDIEKKNVIRFTYDMGASVLVMTVATIINNIAEGQDDDDWWIQYLAYQSNRILLEQLAFTDPTEVLQLLNSPAAGVRQLTTIKTLLGDMFNWDDIERGPYKGLKPVQKQLIKLSPIRSLYELSDPASKNRFLKEKLL